MFTRVPNRIFQDGLINRLDVKILEVEDIAGLGNYDTVSKLRNIYGSKAGIMSIGIGGERELSASTIAITDMEGRPCRHCGRGGLGAVMGSKGIKAVIVDDEGANDKIMNFYDYDGFNKIARNWAKTLVKTKINLTNYGTASLVDIISEAGGLPTRNYSAGQFEGSKKINGITLVKTIESRRGRIRHACSPGCVIKCSNIYNDEKGDYVTAGLEYETIALMGSNLGIDSLDVIAALDRRCDDYGLDTMEMGNALGVAMEAGIVNFGDGEAALRMIDEVAKNSIFGRVLGHGAAVTGKVLGVTRVAIVKGQGMAGYDPRVLKGTGVTYATSPMGADHTAGNVLPGRGGGVNPKSAEGQVKASLDLQIMSAVIDTMGLCMFVGPLPDEMNIIAELLTKATGELYRTEDVMEIGKNVLRTELLFNSAAGIDNAQNRIPEFFKMESLSEDELVFDVKNSDIDQGLRDLLVEDTTKNG